MPNDTQRIEIITGRERRRRYTAHGKARFVEEMMQPGMTVSAVARMHGLSPSLLFGWRRRMAEGGQVAVQADDEVVAASRMRELEGRVRDLERLLGRKTLAAIPSPAQLRASNKTGFGALGGDGETAPPRWLMGRDRIAASA